MKTFLEQAAGILLMAGFVVGGSDGPYFPYANFLGAGGAWTLALVSVYAAARLRGGFNNGPWNSAPGRLRRVKYRVGTVRPRP